MSTDPLSTFHVHDPSMTARLEHRTRQEPEWARHGATWLGWPRYFAELADEWGEICESVVAVVRALQGREHVEIVCGTPEIGDRAREQLELGGVVPNEYRVHIIPCEHPWMRDVLPPTVRGDDGTVMLARWDRRVWRDCPGYGDDARAGDAMASIAGIPTFEPRDEPTVRRIALDGGAIDVNGAGRLLATEQHLLSTTLVHNEDFTRADYERVFAERLGVHETIWLGEGCVGDGTNGHVDNVARWIAPDVIALAYEPDPADENHARSADNLRRLERAGASEGRFRIVRLPFPRPLARRGARLPASYANFYIANGVVLVPTFDDPNDAVSLGILATEFPDRDVIAIPSLRALLGGGGVHCLTREEGSRG